MVKIYCQSYMIAIPVLSSFFKKNVFRKNLSQGNDFTLRLVLAKKERLVMALRKHRRFGMLQNQLSRSENIEIHKKCSQF
jgi:hypothetical protein